MRNVNCGSYNDCLSKVVANGGAWDDDPAAFDCAGCERVNERVFDLIPLEEAEPKPLRCGGLLCKVSSL